MCCVQTGRCHADVEQFEAAEACFGKAQEHCSALDTPSTMSEQASEAAGIYFDVLLDRAQNAWYLQQRVCAPDIYPPAFTVHLLIS